MENPKIENLNVFSSYYNSFFKSFMGHSPSWYKNLVLITLLLNPILLLIFGNFITGWIILLEFIATLALALKCYPLLPGGLLAMEVTFMGMVKPSLILTEINNNLEVILLLIFMVAGIFFMKDFLSWLFTKILFITKSKAILALLFCFAGAFLSAWLDALTVTAVMIAVCLSFYKIYTETSYEERVSGEMNENERKSISKKDLEEFDGFLRNLLMHGAVGTALGGVSTIVGEPQNLLIGSLMNWNFIDFFSMMAHASIPIMLIGLLTSVILEKTKFWGYGYQLPDRVRAVLKKHADIEEIKMTQEDRFKIIVQGLVAIWLIIGLAFHLAAVGLIGLSVIILLTSLTGKSEESQIGKAFEEALPFTALLAVFFAIVGMIQENNLFKPIIDMAFAETGVKQLYSFFFASAILSAISDNVFVATIYIVEAVKAYHANIIDLHQLNWLAIAINVGTNIPSIATPNGQAAFLFLLTSKIASRIRLSYLTMIKLALPYTIILTITATIVLTIDWFPHREPNKLPINPNSPTHSTNIGNH